MILLGDPLIDYTPLYHVASIEAIEHTPPSSIIYLEFNKTNLDIIKHASSNGVAFALEIHNITELIYAAGLGAHYILCSKELGKTAQQIAENYLFDAKILVHIQDEDEIEELAIQGIDGVVFANAIVKTNT